jgi:hypothetical protein
MLFCLGGRTMKNTLWIIEAQLSNSKGKCWYPADFFKMGQFQMPFASQNLREAQKMKKAILSAFYENWSKEKLRITKYGALNGK